MMSILSGYLSNLYAIIFLLFQYSFIGTNNFPVCPSSINFDYEDKYSIIGLAVGGFIALRIFVAVIGAIDSIPLLPKVLELVGLGYTIWFTTRYLIFEQNREKFVARVKQLKEDVIG